MVKNKNYLNELKALAKTVTPLTKKEEKVLFQEGFVTGSMVFGNKKLAKDIDICLCVERPYTEFSNWISSDKGFYLSGRYREDLFHSIYMVNQKGVFINLLLMQENEYNVWYLATKFMKTYMNMTNERKIRVNKKVRVSKFEKFKEFSRKTLDE